MNVKELENILKNNGMKPSVYTTQLIRNILKTD